ncbi:NUAK family SNF1-like kinase 1 [Aphelenchoides fujianensis]|nr:NUAK family SNF1-like kinase 1 [Aphelenchoides fujianensis]
MTVIVGAASSRSSSRTKAPGRLSLTKLKHGSSGGQGPSSTLGGQPFAGADPKQPRDIKHRFEITKKLGSGTYGKVSLAYDHKTEREVAVKLIKKSAIENKQDLIRIRREIRIMSMLKHPNIIQIYENKDKIILVMEYASGGELYDYVSKFGSLPEAEARRIFRQITSAVLYHGPEVDCWSLGILLYTLVYGSMPFDGHDFNRMVRQIKRGAYYEPDTPSTASMLIRNMLRVNPERRADIDDIASHWWLNLEENMPVIQELPENQIVDHTPLTERAEIMVVQDLADETDVFMEFGHLSASTRQKIEEFRRRRKEAEEYNEASPIKPPKTRKTDEMSAKEKSLRHEADTAEPKAAAAGDKSAFHDPLERLRQLESRLQTRQSPDPQPSTSQARRNSKPNAPIQPKAPALPSPTKKEPPGAASSEEDKRPQFVSATGAAEERKSQSKKSLDNTVAPWKVDTDSLNVLMNQLLEQMDVGPVSLSLVARVKAHPNYDQRPMVKELLESIIAAQPAAVRKETSKVIDQAQGLARKQTSTQAIKAAEKTLPMSPIKPQPPTAIAEEVVQSPRTKYRVPELPTAVDLKAAVAQKRAPLEERKWHSVEVGFETDEDSNGSSNGSGGRTIAAAKAGATARITRSADEADAEEDEEVEDESDIESDIDELAEVVESIAQSSSRLARKPKAPVIVESRVKSPEPPAGPSGAAADANHLSTLERRHMHLDMYTRGVSTELSTPPPEKKKIGGPQPTPEQLPVLFDKAKKAIMQYRPEDSDDEKEASNKAGETRLQVDQDAGSRPHGQVGHCDAHSQPPKAKVPPVATAESDESEEESEDEGEPIRKPRTSAIIGFRTIQTNAADSPNSAARRPWKGLQQQQTGADPAEPPPTSTVESKPYAGINKVTPPPAPKDKNPIGAKSDALEEAENGKLSYETASQYIRRKSRERRARNFTIAYTEEAWNRISETGGGVEVTSPSAKTEQRTSVDRDPKIAGRPSETRRTSATIAARVERRNSQLERRNSRTEGASGLERRNSRAAADAAKAAGGAPADPTPPASYRSERRQSREIGGRPFADRRQSFHEYSPVEHDDFASVYGANRAPPSPAQFGGYGAPAAGRRFVGQNSMDEEVAYLTQHSSAHYGAGGVDPSTSGTNLTSSSFYYPTPAVAAFMAHQSVDRPSSAYDPPPSSRRFEVYQTRAEREAAAMGDRYRSGAGHYDRFAERPTGGYTAGGAAGSSGYKSRYDEYGASGYRRPPFEDRSLDFDQMLMGPSDLGFGGTSAGFANPPDPAFGMGGRPAGRRVSSAALRERRNGRARSQSTDRKYSAGGLEMDERLMGAMEGGTDFAYVAYHDSGSSRVSQPREPEFGLAPTRGILKNKQAYEVEPRTSQTREILATRDVFDPPPSSATSKSRGAGGSSFLNATRRRTAEIRLGNDGKLTTTTNGYTLDDDYKRPRSPIDRIKSLFGGGTSSTKKPTTNGVASRYTPSAGASAAGTSSQFKRYTGATTNSRYVPNSTGTRHWFD